jgi:hypothetical protein
MHLYPSVVAFTYSTVSSRASLILSHYSSFEQGTSGDQQRDDSSILVMSTISKRLIV